MKKNAIVIAVIVLAATGALYALTFLDIDAYRADISALVEEQTGRKLNLAGSLQVGFSLTPTVVARDVRFGNAAWGTNPYMLEAEEVAITLSLLGLITGDMVVSRVTAINSNLLLEANTSGAMNWEIETGKAPSDAAATAEVEVSLPDLDLINTTITYKSRRIDQVFRLHLSSLSVVDGFSGIAIDAEGAFDGQPVRLEGVFSGAPSDFEISDFEFKLAEMTVEGAGSAKRVDGRGPYHVVAEVTADRTDVTSWLELVLADGREGRATSEQQNSDSVLDQPVDLSFLDIVTADISMDIRRLGIRGANLRNVTVKLQTTTSGASLELATSYDEKQVRLSAQLERADVPKATVSFSFDELNLEKITDDAKYPIDLASGASASGKADVTARGRTPRAALASLSGSIDGRLELSVLDLTPMANSAEEEERGPADEGLFSEDELPLEFVDGFTGNVDVKIDKIIYGDLMVSDISVPVTFKGQEITSELSARYHEREIRFSHKAQLGVAPTIDFNLIADDFDLGGLLSEFGVTQLADVRADFALNGSVAGRTPKALASSFTGGMNLVAGQGEIASSVFELIAADLVWVLVPKGSTGGRAKLTCALSRVDFLDGVGTMSAFALVTKRMRTSGTGTINLNDETLDLTFYPKPNDTSLLSLSTPIRVTGALTDPSVRPDTTAFLLDAAKIVGVGVLTGGIGAVLPLMSLQNFDAEDAGACLNIINGGKAGAGGINETIESGAGAVTQGAGAIVKGIGDILTSPFK
tara:strand:+ start:1360 stop:3627 length:2268 start_codon:yes stop_codon:yes gene_type:complete